MKRPNQRMYGFLKDYEHLYAIGVVPFGLYLRMRGLYNDSIRPVPKK